MSGAMNPKSTGNSKFYILNNSTNEKMVFQYVPTKMPYSRSANFATIESPGMSYPLTQYVGGAVREFDLELFYYDYPYTGAINTARKFLEALLPPESNAKVFKPPICTLAYGYFVKKVVLEKLEVNDERMNSDGNPLMTRFKLTVRQVGA